MCFCYLHNGGAHRISYVERNLSLKDSNESAELQIQDRIMIFFVCIFICRFYNLLRGNKKALIRLRGLRL